MHSELQVVLLRDKARNPGKELASQAVKNEICQLVCNEKPKGETHLSTRILAKRVDAPP